MALSGGDTGQREASVAEQVAGVELIGARVTRPCYVYSPETRTAFPLTEKILTEKGERYEPQVNLTGFPEGMVLEVPLSEKSSALYQSLGNLNKAVNVKFQQGYEPPEGVEPLLFTRLDQSKVPEGAKKVSVQDVRDAQTYGEVNEGTLKKVMESKLEPDKVKAAELRENLEKVRAELAVRKGKEKQLWEHAEIESKVGEGKTPAETVLKVDYRSEESSGKRLARLLKGQKPVGAYPQGVTEFPFKEGSLPEGAAAGKADFMQDVAVTEKEERPEVEFKAVTVETWARVGGKELAQVAPLYWIDAAQNLAVKAKVKPGENSVLKVEMPSLRGGYGFYIVEKEPNDVMNMTEGDKKETLFVKKMSNEEWRIIAGKYVDEDEAKPTDDKLVYTVKIPVPEDIEGEKLKSELKELRRVPGKTSGN